MWGFHVSSCVLLKEGHVSANDLQILLSTMTSILLCS